MFICHPHLIYLLAALGLLSAASGKLAAQPASSTDDSEPAAYAIQLLNGQTVTLPKSSLNSRQSEDEQRAVLEELSGRQGWESFSRDSISAPVMVKLRPLKDEAGVRIGYVLHSAYVVYADRDQLSDRQLMESMFGQSDKRDDGTVMEELSEEQIHALGVDKLDPQRDQYLWLELPLLNKVLIRGVVHMENSESEKVFHMRWQLDPSFTNGNSTAASAIEEDSPREYRNIWARLSFNNLGALEIGEPQPYQGLGGQFSLFEIDPTKSQLLCESWLVLYEPADWFEADNYLRAKLPASIQESAKRLRRELRSLQR